MRKGLVVGGDVICSGSSGSPPRPGKLGSGGVCLKEGEGAPCAQMRFWLCSEGWALLESTASPVLELDSAQVVDPSALLESLALPT